MLKKALAIALLATNAGAAPPDTATVFKTCYLEGGAPAAGDATTAKFRKCNRETSEEWKTDGYPLDKYALKRDENAKDAADTARQTCVTGKTSNGDDEATIGAYANHDDCVDAFIEAYEQSGGNLAKLKTMQEGGKRDAVKDAFETCVKAANPATKEAMETAQANCRSDAKDAYIAAGGDEDKFEAERREASKDAAGDVGKTCMATKIGALSLADGARPTEAQLKTANAACREEVQEAFEEAGGDPAKFEGERQKAARDELGSLLESCIKAALVAEDAPTDAQKKTAAVGCQTAAKEAFEDAGGDGEKYEREKREALSSNVQDSFKNCVDAENPENESARKTAAEGCKDAVKDALVLAGGDTGDFEKIREKGAKDAAASALKACIFDTVTPPSTAEKVKDAKVSCDAQVKEEYLNAGGEEGEYKKAKREAQVDSVKAGLGSCVDAKKLEGGNDSFTDDEIAAYRDACKDQAVKYFEEAGGNANDFDKIKKEGAKKELKESLTGCLAGKSIDKDSVKAAVKTAKTECEAAVKEEFVAAGGEPGDFKKQQKEAIRDELKDTFGACMRAGGTATTCKTDAKEKFKAAGGDADDFEREQDKAKRDTVKDAASACIDAFKATNDYTDRMTATQAKAAATSCATEVKANFIASGGTEGEFTAKKREAAKKSLQEAREGCVEGDTSDKSVKEKKSSCDDAAKEAFLATGGSERDFKTAKRESAVDWLAEELQACLGDLEDSATDAQIKTAKSGCQTAAAERFEKAGGDKTKIKERAQEAVGKAASETLKSCTDSKANCQQKAKDELAKGLGKDFSEDAVKNELGRRAAKDIGIESVKSCLDGIAAPTDTQKTDCRDTAKDELVAAGGATEDDAVFHIKRAAADQAKGDFDACKEDDDAATDATCLTEAKNSFKAVGGFDEEWTKKIKPAVDKLRELTGKETQVVDKERVDVTLDNKGGKLGTKEATIKSELEDAGLDDVEIEIIAKGDKDEAVITADGCGKGCASKAAGVVAKKADIKAALDATRRLRRLLSDDVEVSAEQGKDFEEVGGSSSSITSFSAAPVPLQPLAAVVVPLLALIF